MTTASREAQWLKRKYQEVEHSGCTGPSIKFSRLADEIKHNFPDKEYCPRTLSAIVHEAFPHIDKQKERTSKNVWVYGIEPTSEGSFDDESVQFQQQIEQLQTEISVCDQEFNRLQRRVAELENIKRTQVSLSTLQSQMSVVMHPNHQVNHGPNTVENFHNFSIESVISELQSHAPDVFQLLKSLGTLSNQEDEGGHHTLKAVIALVALLKSRSVPILGLQLLLTFTLIARATNKQVIQ